MTLNELSSALKEMYATASKGEQTTMIHLFGIRYSNEIQEADYSPKDILQMAGLPSSYVTEINKGIRLAPYVEERNR
ncbi:hypothetical protein [uncultured Oscillibacter sp.]|uniref:HTH-like domain-containing protein n=1 Tax=uncultured Oscillibacter sp. TaxID=876091 RepID=UPI0025D20882|nr:hypothetical protein [uncultured Oscillibacter sp.]